MDKITQQGEKFTEALSVWGGKQIDLATSLGVKPQRIQHWKKRGVSAKYANRVAKLIAANANEISSLDDDTQDMILANGEDDLSLAVQGLDDQDILAVLLSNKDHLTPSGKAKVIQALAASLASDLLKQTK